MVVPTGVLFAVAGVGVATAGAVSIACSILGLVVVYRFGRKLFDDETGLLAAVLLAVFPMDVIFATQLSPTAPVALFAGTAILLFVLGEQVRRPSLDAAAGGCLGVACCFAEVPLLLFVAYGVYAVSLGRPRRRHAAALIGFAAVLVADMAVSAWLYGDPLNRFAMLTGSQTVRGVNPDVAHAGWTLEWLAHPLLRIASEQELGLYLVLGLPLAAWRLVRSESRIERTLCLFVLVLFVWISYGTISLTRYAPLARLPRYFSVFQLPLVLLLASWLRRMTPLRRRGLAALVVATSLLCVLLDGSRFRSYGYQQVHALIAGDRPRRVVVDGDLLTAFLFFEGYDPPMPVALLRATPPPGRVVRVEGARPTDRETELALAGTYVVVRSRAARALLGERDDFELVSRFPPPDTWYRRLLRNPVLQRVLGFTRSRYRMDGLRQAAADSATIEVYRPVGDRS